MSEGLLYYFVPEFVLLLVFAIRAREPEYEAMAWLLLLWPVTVIVMLAWWVMHIAGWCFDFDHTPEHLTKFGYRRPDDNWPGVAVRGFGFELRFWRDRK